MFLAMQWYTQRGGKDDGSSGTSYTTVVSKARGVVTVLVGLLERREVDVN